MAEVDQRSAETLHMKQVLVKRLIRLRMVASATRRVAQQHLLFAWTTPRLSVGSGSSV